MYGKIFRQIYSSSIARDYKVRHVFMDLIVLADADGIIDMTHESIAGITGVPIDDLRMAIEILEKPDPESRSKELNGVRLTRLDQHRRWGWQIVNYQKYREIRCEFDRKSYMKNYMRKKRACKTKSLTEVNAVKLSPSSYASDQDRGGAGGGRFTKPTFPELELHAQKIGLPVTEVNKFFDYYESNGWRVGRNPMKSWQSAMQNWKRNYEQYQRSPSGGRNHTENPRNVGVCVAGPSFAEAAALKLRRQDEERQRDLQSGLALQAAGPETTPPRPGQP